MRYIAHIAALIAVSSVMLPSCSDPVIVRDRPRTVNNWLYPNDFEPAFITEDENGVRWGLFVSQRFSAKNNIWVTYSDGSEWQTPLIVMNAYQFDSLSFAVRSDSLYIEFVGLSDDYFFDYNAFTGDTMDLYRPVNLAFPLALLRSDCDGDNMPDRIESELLTSTRLPDSDTDDKTDDLDFCPLGSPVVHDARFDVYKATLERLARLDDPEKMQPSQDTAWTKFYGMYYLNEPNTLYLVLVGEKELPEIPGLGVVLIQVRAPLYFTSRDSYRTSTGGVIPHLIFHNPKMGLFDRSATMRIEHVTSKYAREAAMVSLERTEGGEWSIKDIVIEEN